MTVPRQLTSDSTNAMGVAPANPMPDAPCGPSEQAPRGWRLWLLAIRPFSFTASVVPIVVASSLAIAEDVFNPMLGLIMLVASVSCHAGANLANDFFDHQKGIDSLQSLGPSGIIQRQLLSPGEVKRGMLIAFGIATLLGSTLVWNAGWPILVLALLSLGVAIFYTGGPTPLGYIALGEVSVFLVMGVGIIGGAYYVFRGSLTWASLLVAIPIGCLVALILHANNIRDRVPDRASGKKTLATILGRRGANIEFLILVTGAYVGIIVLVAVVPSAWPTLVTLVTAPWATRLTRRTWLLSDLPSLYRVVRETAQLHFRFGLLLTTGLLARPIAELIA